MQTKSAAPNAATPVRRILVISISSLVVPIALRHAAAIRRAFERADVQLAGEPDGQIITDSARFRQSPPLFWSRLSPPPDAALAAAPACGRRLQAAAIAHRIRGAGAGIALDSEGHARRRGRAHTRRPNSRPERPRRAPGADADRAAPGRAPPGRHSRTSWRRTGRAPAIAQIGQGPRPLFSNDNRTPTMKPAIAQIGRAPRPLEPGRRPCGQHRRLRPSPAYASGAG